jgi:hypothetical protein
MKCFQFGNYRINGIRVNNKQNNYVQQPTLISCK